MLALQQFSLRQRLHERRRLLIALALALVIWTLTQAGLDYRQGIDFSLANAEWTAVFWRYTAVLILGHLLLALLQPKADQMVLPLIGLLGGLSLALLYRLPTPYWDAEAGRIVYAARNMWYVERQALFLAAGQGLIILTAAAPGLLRWLRDHRYMSILLGLSLLMVTALFGVEAAAGGPRVSLNLGFVRFQPAELIKLLFVIYLASYLRLVRPDLKRLTYHPLRVIPVPHFNQLRPIAIILLSALVFLVWMSDLGAALILFFIFPLMMYVALPRRVFWYLAGLALVGAYLLVGGLNWAFAYGYDPLQAEDGERTALLDYAPQRVHEGLERAGARLENQRDPWAACTEANGCASYQTLHAVYAVAAGGLWGVGPGQGLAGNIPFVHTDMIYAAVAEEWGLLGAAALLLLYWLLVQRGLRIARAQSDPFNGLLAAGVATIFALQIFIIVGGTINIIPLTGITLPFLSYGGTAIIVNSLMVGLLLRISADATAGEMITREAADSVAHLRQLYSGAFLLLILGTLYWSVWMRPQLSPAFAAAADTRSQNPVAWQREAAWLARVERGRILAADGSVLAGNGQYGREYRSPSLVHIVGQADGRGKGLSGLESAYNNALLGRGRYDLSTLWAQQFDGEWQGNDLVLTIEPRWQQAAHEALGGYSGAVVVLDAETGAVLAMVSHPLYDPYAALTVAGIDRINSAWNTPFVNRATSGLYPPGSTFKTVVGATAVAQGAVTGDSFFDFKHHIWYWEGGRLCHKQAIGGAIIVSCNSDQQQMSFSEGFAASDNILFAELAVQLGGDRVWQGAADFGFGQSIPFDLPTAASQLAANPDWLRDPANLAMTGFGQSQAQATPLQMALVAAAIANEGKTMQPYLISQVVKPNGGVLERTRPQVWQRPLNQADAAAMYAIMVESVETGWANSAAVPGLVVGGKTGTAEWSGTLRGQAPHSWFIGFAEMPDGRTVAIAVLAESAGEGSIVAAPIAAAVVGGQVRP